MNSEFVSKLVRDTIQRHGETRGIMTSAVDVSELGEIPAEARLPTPVSYTHLPLPTICSV